MIEKQLFVHIDVLAVTEREEVALHADRIQKGMMCGPVDLQISRGVGDRNSAVSAHVRFRLFVVFFFADFDVCEHLVD